MYLDGEQRVVVHLHRRLDKVGVHVQHFVVCVRQANNEKRVRTSGKEKLGNERTKEKERVP